MTGAEPACDLPPAFLTEQGPGDRPVPPRCHRLLRPHGHAARPLPGALRQGERHSWHSPGLQRPCGGCQGRAGPAGSGGTQQIPARLPVPPARPSRSPWPRSCAQLEPMSLAGPFGDLSSAKGALKCPTGSRICCSAGLGVLRSPGPPPASGAGSKQGFAERLRQNLLYLQGLCRVSCSTISLISCQLCSEMVSERGPFDRRAKKS